MKRSKSKSFLFIDTARSGEFRIGFLRDSGAKFTTGVGRSNKFLSVLARQLNPQTAKALAGVCVVSGPGSFTAVRTGVLIANLLARYWGMPLYGVSVEQARDAENLFGKLAKGGLEPAGYVAPVYDTEPNITLKASIGPKCYV